MSFLQKILVWAQLFLHLMPIYNYLCIITQRISKNMDELKKKLSTRVSKLYVNELCHRAQTDSRIMNELYLLATDDDEKTSWNALWVLSCLTNQESLTWLCQKHDELINLALKETHDGKRRLILNLLSKQEFDKDGLRTDFIDFCMSRILSATETVASKALCVKMAYKQCIHYEELTQELKQCLDMMQQEQLPPAVISAVNNIRKKLNKLK